APTYCDHDDFLDVMDALELGMEATYTESVDLQRTDTPQCSMAELSAGCDNNRVVFMSTHHGHDAEFLIAGFATQSARDAALAVVRATYGNSYFAATDPGFPGIKM